jgi:hypothetical protein
MPASTTRGALPYPLGTDPPDTDGDIRKLAERLAAVGALYLQDTASARPAAGVDGRLFLATDTGVVSYDTGSAWTDLLTEAAASAAYATKAETGLRSFGAPSLGPGSGAPVRGVLLDYWPVWLLDATTNESVGIEFTVPEGWGKIAVDAVTVNAGTGTGDYRLRLVYNAVAKGGTLAVTGTNGVTIAALAQNAKEVVEVLNNFAVTPGQTVLLMVERRGADAVDTLPNDIGLLSVDVRRTA